ncbi:unnamed protein product [Colias eurytheme]|nr:unnamed protein product [Colias eurytheme]
MLWQIIIILCILWYLLELWKIRRVVAASRQLKSSFISLPVIGHSYMFIGSNEDRMTAIKKVSYDAMKNATNVSNMRMAFEFYTVVVDAEAIDILSKEFLNKPPMLYRFSRKLLGDGSLMAPLNIWRPRRKLLAPMFGQKNLLYFVKEFSKQSMILAQNLQSVAGGEAFSVWPFFTTYTLDTVCETALGIQLDKKIQKHEEFRQAFEEYTVIGSRRMFKPWLYPGAIYRLHPDCKKLKKYGATVNQFITDVSV